MNTAQCANMPGPNMPGTSGNHILPPGFWSGFFLFGALWLVPVLTLIAIAYR